MNIRYIYIYIRLFVTITQMTATTKLRSDELLDTLTKGTEKNKRRSIITSTLFSGDFSSQMN